MGQWIMQWSAGNRTMHADEWLSGSIMRIGVQRHTAASRAGYSWRERALPVKRTGGMREAIEHRASFSSMCEATQTSSMQAAAQAALELGEHGADLVAGETMAVGKLADGHAVQAVFDAELAQLRGKLLAAFHQMDVGRIV